MEQIYNPYMPLLEHVPDGEPHVFGDRVYVYGSHDRAGGKEYCEDDYVVWSAPAANLRDWRFDGLSYRKTQDPANPDGKYLLYAPDCIKGPDGRYYLYYALNGLNTIGVAVSEVPEGPFSYYGNVGFPSAVAERAAREAGLKQEGEAAIVAASAVPATGDAASEAREPGAAASPAARPAGEEIPATPEAWIKKMEQSVIFFDPGVFVEDGRVWLYFGFCRSFGVELLPDMLTAAGEITELLPGRTASKGTPFEGHAFFEASSMRKFGDKYYLIYSSEKSHELCYAVGKAPLGPFEYGGVLVSNGDIGVNGHLKPVTQFGNNHGSVEKIGDDYYVFYHRQTNGTEFSRQACAEKIEMGSDGHFRQAEITSCGLNGGALTASGSYPAAIACHIADRTMPEKVNYRNWNMKAQAHVTQEQNQVYITGIRDKTKIGFRYFRFIDADLIAVELRGRFFGKLKIAFDEQGKDAIGELEVQVDNSEWEMELVPVIARSGKHPLYLYFKGQGELEFKTIAFFSA